MEKMLVLYYCPRYLSFLNDKATISIEADKLPKQYQNEKIIHEKYVFTLNEATADNVAAQTYYWTDLVDETGDKSLNKENDAFYKALKSQDWDLALSIHKA